MLSLRQLFTKNIGVKLLSVAMAAILWFMAVGRQRAEVGLTVPIELINIPQNLVVANEIPDGISVRVRGSVALTRQVADRRPRFSLDLAGARKGENKFILQPESLGLPGELEVTKLSPNTIMVKLEGVTQKTVALLPVIRGEPLAGFIIEDISLEPRTVEVRGPESILAGLDVLWTEAIDVTTLSGPTVLQTKPSLPDVALSLLKNSPVKVRLKIGEKIATREFKDIPIEVILPPDEVKGFSITPNSANLVIRGPVGAMSAVVTGQDLNIRVNLAGLEPGRHQRMLIVSVPPQMEVVNVTPRLVEVEIYEGIQKRVE